MDLKAALARRYIQVYSTSRLRNEWASVYEEEEEEEVVEEEVAERKKRERESCRVVAQPVRQVFDRLALTAALSLSPSLSLSLSLARVRIYPTRRLSSIPLLSLSAVVLLLSLCLASSTRAFLLSLLLLLLLCADFYGRGVRTLHSC